MSEQATRAAVGEVLGGLGLATIKLGALRKVPAAPAAGVHLRGFALEARTRGGGASLVAFEYGVTFYVDADVGDEEVAEDALGAFLTNGALAFEEAGCRVEPAEAVVPPSPIQLIDGRPYRVGRLRVILDQVT